VIDSVEDISPSRLSIESNESCIWFKETKEIIINPFIPTNTHIHMSMSIDLLTISLAFEASIRELEILVLSTF
jgi:hypothetical protein